MGNGLDNAGRVELADHYVATVLGRLRVRTGGSGPAIVFWPNLLMDGSLWSAQAEYFGSSGWRVVVVDPPGHGASEPLTGPFSFEDCARCVVEVLDALGLETAHFVGNSWGGMIGGTFAALYPDRVGSAVLMNCTASPAGRRQRTEYMLLTRCARLLGAIRPPLVRPVVKAFTGPTTRRTRPSVVSAIRKTARGVNVDSVFWAVTSVVPRRPDQRALFASIRTPVLVVAGAEDATFPVPETSAMANAIPGSEFVILDGAAHLAALEVSDRVNTLVADFLTR